MTVPSLPSEAARASLERFQVEQRRLQRSLDMAAKATAKFREFVPIAWPSVEPSREFIATWHMDAIADHLQAVADGQIKNLLITVPPGTSKSLLASVLFPAWMWLPGRKPGWRATFASYESKLSTRDSVRCRGLLESNWYKETFKPEWKFSSDQNEKTYYANTAKGFRVSTSVTGRGTGWRGDAIFADDVLNASDRFSEAALSQCTDWWDNTMFNRLNSLLLGTKVIIMQRLSDRDLAGHVLRLGGYEHLMIPMEYDPARSKVTCIGWKDPRTKKDELMFPELFPKVVVDDLKLNPLTYAGQYQQSPNTEGGGILKAHKWKYWKPAGMNLPAVRVKLPNGDIEERYAVELPDDFDMQIQGWDFAFKDLKTSDYVVGQVHGARGANRFILDQIRGRMSFTESVAAVRELTGRRPKAFLKLVEDKANGPAVIDTLHNEIAGLVEVNPHGGKVSRAAAASVELDSGNWYLPHPMIAPWVGNPENSTEGGFLAETVLFPFGANDDMVDCWSMIALRIQTQKAGTVFPTSETDIRVERPEISDKWARLVGIYSDYKTFAAVWIVRQPDTGVHFAYAEHLSQTVDPVEHAKALRAKGSWVPGIMVSSENQAIRREVYAVGQKLSANGFSSVELTKVAEPEILQLRDALQAKKLQVSDSCKQFFDQYRMFRRDDNGKLPSENHGLIMALAAAWRERAKVIALVTSRPAPKHQFSGSMGWAKR